jgi:hypothetical protein
MALANESVFFSINSALAPNLLSDISSDQELPDIPSSGSVSTVYILQQSFSG